MKLEIGTKLKLLPSICVDGLGRSSQKPIDCTVVYINKPHRYFTAEFVFPNGSFRESFKFHYKSDLVHKEDEWNRRPFGTWKKSLFW